MSTSRSRRRPRPAKPWIGRGSKRHTRRQEEAVGIRLGSLALVHGKVVTERTRATGRGKRKVTTVERPARPPFWKSVRSTARSTGHRQRHTLAGVATAAGGLLAAAVVHTTRHPGPLAALLAAAAVGVGAWVASGMRTRTQVAYCWAVTTLAAVWLALAADLGLTWPGRRWATLSGLAVAGLALGPWHSRHTARDVAPPPPGPADVWRDRLAADGKPLAGVALLDPEPIPDVEGGWRAGFVSTADDKTGEDVLNAKTRHIARVYGVGATRVYVEVDQDNINKGGVMVFTRNPLGDVKHWPGYSLTRDGHFCMGPYADAKMAHWTLLQPGSGATPGLVAGEMGSGKSRFLDMLLAEATHADWIVTWGIDPQSGQSFPEWVPHLDRFAGPTDDPDDDLVDIRGMLRDAVAVMQARQKYLATVEWTDERGRKRKGCSYFDLRFGLPLLLIPIDEAHVLALDPDCLAYLKLLLKMGRKTGVAVILLTQYPSIAELGAQAVRGGAQSGNVISYRTDSIGGRMAFQGGLEVDPSKLPKGKQNAGICYASTPLSSRTVELRTYFIEDVLSVVGGAVKVELHPVVDLGALAAAAKAEGVASLAGAAALVGQPAEIPGDVPGKVWALLEGAEGVAIPTSAIAANAGCSKSQAHKVLCDFRAEGKVTSERPGKEDQWVAC